jgi:hypothetical protein
MKFNLNLPNLGGINRISPDSAQTAEQPAKQQPNHQRGSGFNLLTRRNGQTLSAQLQKKFQQLKANPFSSEPKLSPTERMAAEKAAAFGNAANLIVETGRQGLAQLADKTNVDRLMMHFEQGNTTELKNSAKGNGDLRKLFAGLEALGSNLAHVPAMGGKLTPQQEAIAADAKALLDTPIAESGGEQFKLVNFGAPHIFDKVQLTPAEQQNLRAALDQVAELHANAGNPNYAGKPAASTASTDSTASAEASVPAGPTGASLRRNNNSIGRGKGAIEAQLRQGMRKGESLQSLQNKSANLQASADAFKKTDRAQLADLQKQAHDAFKPMPRNSS